MTNGKSEGCSNVNGGVVNFVGKLKVAFGDIRVIFG